MNIFKQIKEQKKLIIIFGAGVVGEVLLQACLNNNIRVDYFCDNDKNKTEKLLNNIPIIHTSVLKDKYKDAIFLISAADIKDVVDQLNKLGCLKWYACNSLLRDFNIYDYEYSKSVDFVVYATSTAILCHDSYLTPKKLFLRSVDIIVTERCSLRCRDCSNLMRYYKSPKDTEFNILVKEINKLCELVDEINEFRVLGGEPFMNKDFHLIIKRLVDEPKVKKIIIYTNGTIIPRIEQIEYFKNNKVLFLITDYGSLSRNLEPLIKILSDNDIAFYAQKARGWTDCSKIIKHNRNISEKKDIFNKCCVKNTITLSEGKIFRCPFSANAFRLRAVPKSDDDFVDIFEKGITDTKLKIKIKNYILDKDFLEVCDYCNGRSFGDPEITPSIQQMEINNYQQYTY